MPIGYLLKIKGELLSKCEWIFAQQLKQATKNWRKVNNSEKRDLSYSYDKLHFTNVGIRYVIHVNFAIVLSCPLLIHLVCTHPQS